MSGLSNFDYKMFEAARKVAETSDFETFHIGCVIVYKKHIVSSASNTQKTHPKQKKYNKKYRHFNKSPKPIMDSGHAEMLALSGIPYPLTQSMDWKNVKVYIYRICKGKPFGFGMSRPCRACYAALRDAGVQHIYYTTDNGFAYERIYQ